MFIFQDLYFVGNYVEVLYPNKNAENPTREVGRIVGQRMIGPLDVRLKRCHPRVYSVAFFTVHQLMLLQDVVVGYQCSIPTMHQKTDDNVDAAKMGQELLLDHMYKNGDSMFWLIPVEKVRRGILE